MKAFQSVRTSLLVCLLCLGLPTAAATTDDDDFPLASIVAALRPTCTGLQANPTVGTVGLPLTLTVTCTKSPSAYVWSGNGQALPLSPTALPTISVTPTQSGLVTYSVTAKTGNIGSLPISISVNVNANAQPAIGTFTVGAANIALGGGVTLQATATDPNVGDTVALQFFANGVSTGPGGGANFNQSWTPTREGVYTIVAVATDSFGAKTQSQSQVVVVSPVPNVSLNLPTGTSNVGFTPGTFSVGDSGAATYSVPIAVPPGSSGMQPALSLVYSSQGGDGHLGSGWKVAGLSAIYRCPMTPAQDRQRSAINYDTDRSNDVYCLDGERLIKVADLGNGQVEYRTERETFARIRSYAEYDTVLNPSAPNYLLVGPSRFRVWTKGGTIQDYGAIQWIVTQGNQQPPRLNSAKLWALDRVADRVGNYMTIRYEAGPTSTGSVRDAAQPQQSLGALAVLNPIGPYPPVEFFPTEIVYTRNDNSGAQPNAFQGVRFNYVTRAATAQQTLFDSGAGQTLVTQRLASIETYTDVSAYPVDYQLNQNGRVASWGNLVKRYSLGYQQGSATQRLRLSTITETSGDNVSLNATTFTWNDAATGFNGGPSSPITGPADGSDVTAAADFDGDGKSDLLRAYSSSGYRVERCLSTGSGFTCLDMASGVPSNAGQFAGRKPFFADVNGDGKADYVQIGVNNIAWVCPSNGVGLATCWSQALMSASTVVYAYFAGDFNGDGKIDLLAYNGNALWTMCLSTGSAFNCISNVVGPNGPNSPTGNDTRTLIADLNGDGRADIIMHAGDNGTDPWIPCLSDFGPAGSTNSNSFTCPSAGTTVFSVNGPLNKISIFDFNGDGLADMAAGNPSTGQWQIALSAGDGTFVMQTWQGSLADASQVVFGDFNGDGRTDTAFYDTSTGKWQVCLSTGSSFSCTTGASNWTSPATPNGNGAQDMVSGDFNGDGRTDLAVHRTGSNWNLGLANGSVGDLVTQIQNGLTAATQIDYKPLTDASVYSKGGITAGADEVIIQSPLYVVSQTRASTTSAATPWFVRDYFYTGLKGNTAGRGALGFQSKLMTENSGGGLGNTLTTQINYRQDWPFAGRVDTITKKLNGAAVNLLTYSWNRRCSQQYPSICAFPAAGPSVLEIYQTQLQDQSYEIGGAALPLVTTAMPLANVDGYGNQNVVTVTTGDGFTKTTTNSYVNDATNWLLGQLMTATVNSSLPGALGSLTRSSSFTYYAAGSQWPGLLNTEVIEPGDATGKLKQTTTYLYDAWGNRKQFKIDYNDSGTLKSRTTDIVFEVRGRFPQTITDPKLFAESRSYDQRFGGITIAQSPNQNRVENAYDGFGRKVAESHFDAATGGHLVTRSVIAWDRLELQTGESYRQDVVTSDGGEAKAFFDSLQREVRRLTKQFDGTFATSATVYDPYGRKDHESRPYAGTAGASPIQTTTYQSYDGLNRITSVLGPDGVTTGTAYSVMNVGDGDYPPSVRTQITVTRSKAGEPAQTTTRQLNSQAQVLAAIDAQSNTTRYVYDPFGNLGKVTSPNSAQAGTPVLQMFYDIRGRKTRMVDPDLGTWLYDYNGVGELKTQTDARNYQTTFQYDALGRALSRAENGPGGTFTTSWFYDDDSVNCLNVTIKTRGQVCRVAVSGGVVRDISYDAQARPYRSFTTFAGRTYGSYTLYDALARVRYVGYPESVPGFSYGVYQDYNGNGYLNKISDVASRTLWEPLSRYQDGQLNQSRIGGTTGITTTRNYDLVGRISQIAVPNNVETLNYTYSPLGNVSTRVDSIAGYNETFSYDTLNRMTGVAGKVFAYDPLGNLTSKSDLPGGSFTYNLDSHRVATAGGRTYGYDANGNVTSDGLRTITPNAFNLPSTIVGNGQTLTYDYDGDHARIREIVQGALSTVYIGNRFFEEVAPFSGATQWKHYIATPEGVVAVAASNSSQTLAGAAPALTFQHLDGLGSVVAETDAFGNSRQLLGFDAWGKRRSSSGGDIAGAFGLPGNISSLSTQRGFTGHEHLDEVGLVHMNGRLYDPWLGRFVSGDPMVQAPYNLQSYNRYSYVLNNPLGFTDPTGFSWWTQWRRPIIAIAAAVIGQYYVSAEVMGAWAASTATDAAWGAEMAVATQVANGAGAVAGGFAAGGIMGGNLQSAAEGALFAGFSFGIGEITGHVPIFGSESHLANVALHAAVGCGQQAAAGGSCRGGALSAGFAAFAGPATGGGLASQVVIGAVASRIAGDKAQNGALTAAFEYLFNTCATKACEDFLKTRGLEAVSSNSNGIATTIDYSDLPANTLTSEFRTVWSGDVKHWFDVSLTPIVEATIKLPIELTFSTGIETGYREYKYDAGIKIFQQRFEQGRLVSQTPIGSIGSLGFFYAPNPFDLTQPSRRVYRICTFGETCL